MVIGGQARDDVTDVELISLDPNGHPVPKCLKKRNDFPEDWLGAVSYSNNDGRSCSLDNTIIFLNNFLKYRSYLHLWL